MKAKDYVWPLIGIAAAVFSGWLLYKEVRTLSLDDLIDSILAIRPHQWALSALGAVIAYAALACYDQIALRHLGRRLPWRFVALTSFTTYALSHNIGASVLSGAVVRYRAYTSRGLTGGEVGLLVALCSMTFAIGAAVLIAILLLTEPEVITRFFEDAPLGLARGAGFLIVVLIALYVWGSVKRLRPVHRWGVTIQYPRPEIVGWQLIVAPIEIIGAAMIIYFVLPEAGNPGYFVVLGIFVASFCVALLSHAPGGLGVLELLFLTGLKEMNEADVLAALLVFRLMYLLIPFAISIVVVLAFERMQFTAVRGRMSPAERGE
ncbi:lysylphosphatidylglycerol synthase transmembrane domain-containing protein [Chthonobacter rhizosphaerae]|uniref:lysylphosphatidylglycerol synthase transmembrane domain-containing protein n=1 Tax=Chthonobacter rhizosphaerae TaxID=2735553 RepID=UPI0015EFC9A2|nr:YbhN family protein [Chthonobacter rhizosphaerae]